jgi:class 3 adenylate cyclase
VTSSQKVARTIVIGGITEHEGGLFMPTLAGWLQEHGLDQYADVFAQSEIDLDVMPDLTERDLAELGLPLGARKRFMRPIRSPTASSPAAIESSPSSSPSSPIVSIAEGERRQLTVLFCDMVGFTELASRVDPEVLQRIIRSYEDACTVCITRYEGYVFQRLGDGIVAFFGYPLAHEGEAERAIRAALEIIESLSHLDVPDAGHLAVRIGIATGLVVVSSAEKRAVGETMNLAARLQAVAQPGSIVVSERVHRLARGSFDYADLGEQTLKGIARPTHAYRIVGVSEAASRFEAAHAEAGLTPLVGREQEIGLLLERWALAQDGEGQVVMLSGEPGIGKSRILTALRERLERQGAQALRFQCSPYYVNSAFWPSIDNFERALRFGRDEPPESKLDKLEALIVTHYGRPLADVRFIASILSIHCDERYGALPMTPQKHRNETLRTLVDLTDAAARKQPSVMLFEDLHWADPTTLEVLDLLIDRVRSIPLLVVLTHRPEFQSRWSEQGHVSALNLSKLTRAQSAAIVSSLAGGKALPAALLEQILAKTDGVPLFVEELTKSILESGEFKDAGDRYEYSATAHTVRARRGGRAGERSELGVGRRVWRGGPGISIPHYLPRAPRGKRSRSRPKQPGMINGGLYKKPTDPLGQHPSVVIAVTDIHQALKKVKEAGGKVLGEPMDIPGVGLYAGFLDTEGNRVSVLQPSANMPVHG